MDIIKKELKEHLPFTMLGVLISILILCVAHLIFIKVADFNKSVTFERFFHLFHFTHIFLSATASASIYYRHARHVLKSIAIGAVSTLVFCGLSDAILPFIGGTFLGVTMHFHLCLLNEPITVLLATITGVWAGIVLEVKLGKISYVSHSAHVLVSSLASLFYLVTFGVESWFSFLIGLFIVTTLAVVIPCCSSDIVLPVSFASGFHGHEHEDEHTEP